MKLRQHKGGYDESMATVVEIEPTKAAILQAILFAQLVRLPHPLTEDQIIVAPYVYDSRNGWNTHSVVIKDWGVYGFTDGPVREPDTLPADMMRGPDGNEVFRW